MSFARLCFFYILIALAESSPLVAFLVLNFALPYKLSPSMSRVDIEVGFKADLDQRAVRDRYNLLANKLGRKLKEEEKAFGIETDMTELEAALEDLIEREYQSDAQHKENQEQNIKKKEDRETAEDMRTKSLETLGETPKKKKTRHPAEPSEEEEGVCR